MQDLNSIKVERNKRLQSRANNGLEAEEHLKKALDRYSDTVMTSRIRAAFEFAKCIEYKHPGLSPSAYIAHPVRVACLSLALIKPPDEDTVVLSLLHNIFEVSDVTEALVAASFGTAVAKAIRDLTVDRSRNDEDYKRQYYQRLQEGPAFTRVVKLLDKLDNLFLLGLNPNADVREQYLREIEVYIIPIAHVEAPGLVRYLEDLVADSRRIGFIKAET